MPKTPVDPSLSATDPGTRLDDLRRNGRTSRSAPEPDAFVPPPVRSGRWKVWLKRLVVVGLVGFVAGAGTLAGLIYYYSRDLPRFESLADYHPPQVTKVFAADGTTMVGEIFDERRTVVPIEDIPGVMVQALLSAEDKNFFQHSGVDYLGILKAAIGNLRPGAHTRGASTLTQQIVKTMLLNNKREFSRKFKEAILAHRLEQNLSKQDILYLYLNHIFFGNNRYGIEEASRFYFGKSAKDLDVGEAAMLASTPKDPNVINPRGNLKRLKERQTYVLREMVANGFIPQEVAEREIAKPIPMAPQNDAQPGGYYVEEVRRILNEKLGEEVVQQGGLQVETMMNPELQQAAEDAMRTGLRELDKRQGWRGALARIEDPAWDRLRPLMLSRLQASLEHKARDVEANAVLDLKRLELTHVETAKDDDLAVIAHAVAWRRREPDTEVLARVTRLTKAAAFVDLGTTEGLIPLASTGWAREFNPTAVTSAPRDMNDVVKPGDLVLVRVAKIVPCDPAARAKGKCTEDRVELALEQHAQVEGALVSIDPKNRAVLALVGGYDHKRSPFNRATQARRQPGSAFKPFVYATALEVGQERALLPADASEDARKRCVLFQPRQTVYDTPEVIRDKWTGKPWVPKNFERDFFAGPMSMRQALAESKNTVAVKLIADIGCEPSTAMPFEDMQQHGLDRVKETVKHAGIDSPVPDSITAALGSGEVVPLELVNAYTTIAMQGRYAAPALIKRVRAPGGEILFETKTTYEQPPPLAPGLPPTPSSGRGLRADVAFVTTQVMRSVVEDPNGTARSMASLGRPIAGKTGTASEHRDGWFVGFTPEVVTGVWVGFDDHTMLGARETGGHCAGPIWLRYMKFAEDKVEHQEWVAPPGVVQLQIDPRTGLLADEHSPFVESEYYLAGTEPRVVSPPQGEAKTEDFLRGDGP